MYNESFADMLLNERKSITKILHFSYFIEMKTTMTYN